jgi:hypothetical protein
MTYLWTGSKKAKIPEAYIELVLCRDVFHCTPGELYEQDYIKVQELLQMHSTELYVTHLKRKAAAARAAARRGRRKK